MGDASFRKHRPCSEEGRGPDYSGQRTFKLLFTASATATTRRSPALRTGRNSWAHVRRGCGSARRHEPQLNVEFRPAATVNSVNAARIDATRVHQVVLGAIGAIQAFALARSIANDRGA